MITTTDKLVSSLMPRRTWLQFSLGSMLVFVAAICVLLAVRSNRQHNRRVAIAKIESLGGRITYLSQWEDLPKDHWPEVSLWARLLGDDLSTCIVAVYFLNDGKLTDSDLAILSRFSDLRLIVTGSNPITDEGLMTLAPLSELMWIAFNGKTNVTEAGIAEFQKALPNCQSVDWKR